MTGHTLAITTTWPDGHEDTWHYQQPGDAAVAHDNLAKRWKAAGFTYTRDRATLTLLREYDHPELGQYVDTVRHEPWEAS